MGLFVHDAIFSLAKKVLSAFSQKAGKCVINSNCCYNEEVLVNGTLNNLQPQSGVELGRPTTDDNTATQVNLTFDDQENEGTSMSPVIQRLYKPTSSQNSDISNFLSRPVLVKTINMGLGATIDTKTDVWYDFFNHTSIKKKIDNYAFIRCDLHVKFVINASPFYYGAILCSYIPLEDEYNSAFIGVGGDKLVPYSQRPHVVCYPQTCEGGELIAPFIYPREWLDLTSASTLRAMGAIDIDSFVPLVSANGTVGTSVDLQIYAWAENVELAGLTVSLAVQAGDEYGKGIVSKPASAIARSTGMLAKVPVIGPFMTATSIAANAVSNIASIFGYSKVPVLDDVKPLKNLPFHGLAVSDVSDCTERLCVDSKNELTINNTCIGDTSSDPLMISDFVQRQSYLTKFTWTAADAAGTLLWNTYVTPYSSSITAGTGQAVVQGTPPWVIANMFDYWRGDMIYDLKILCTQYHKGRLRVSWDPVGDIAATSASSTEVYTAVIDISENTTVSLRVPYCQRVAYLGIPGEPGDEIYNTTALPVDTLDIHNGILTIRVLNEQTSPVASADITVLVSVRGAENLEFAYPKKLPDTLMYYTVQSGLEDVQTVNFGGQSNVDDKINLVYMGEKIVNVRSLLMRSNYAMTNILYTSTTADRFMIAYNNRRPLYRGFDPNGIDSAVEIVGAGNAPYNFVSNTPYHMISQCFLGERGSFTWKINTEAHNARSVSATRSTVNLTSIQTFLAVTLSASSNNIIKGLLHEFRETTPGTSLINQRTNTGLSVNVPQYSEFSFLDTTPVSRTRGLATVTNNDTLAVSYNSYRTSAIRPEYTDYYFQVGHDYSPVFFLNVPTMYIYDSVPTGQP